VGTGTVHGTDVGLLVDFPRDRISLFFVITVMRMMSGGGRFMCRGHQHGNDEAARLHREVEAKP